MSPVFRVDAEPTTALDEDANVLFVETPIVVEHNIRPTEQCFFVIECEKATIIRRAREQAEDELAALREKVAILREIG
jgi:hypothetical protein